MKTFLMLSLQTLVLMEMFLVSFLLFRRKDASCGTSVEILIGL